MTSPAKLQTVLDAIDAYNRQDPNVQSADAVSGPREWVYSQRLTAWVLRLAPGASEALRIAARGQHIGRWTVPRDRYPMDRAGYLRWREDLKRFHSRTVVGMMAKAGYDETTRERVRSMMLKKNLKQDPEAQTLEDALCLVFLETQFDELAHKTPDDKMIDIIKKTWAKMGDQGRAEALKIPMPPAQETLIRQALAGHS